MIEQIGIPNFQVKEATPKDAFSGERPLVTLTATQERAAQAIKATLAEPTPHKLIVLDGFSGVGKSLVIDRVAPDIAQNKGVIVDLRSIRGFKSIRGLHVVTTAVPSELRNALEERDIMSDLPGYELVTHILPGMNSQETNAYVDSLDLSKATITEGQVAYYSLGVPLLAQRLLLPGLTEDSAARIAAGFILRNFGRRWISDEEMRSAQRDYLQVTIPSDVEKAIGQMDRFQGPQYMYRELNRVLVGQEDQKKAGVDEESPLFVAPESEQIYNEMLDKFESRIEIFVPNLTPADAARMNQALGLVRSRWNERVATRREMFGASYRKVSFWHRDEKGAEFFEDNEHRWLDEAVKLYEKAYRDGKLGLKPLGSKKPISYFIHAHEHPNTAYHPANVGWMVESMLQQRGIAYFVNNDTHESSYIYNPDTKHIEVLSERVLIEQEY